MRPLFIRELSRRQFMKAGLASAAVLCFPNIALSRPAPVDRERALSFYNLHTGERMETVFWSGGSYHPSALSEIDRFMRDFRTGEVRRIDPRLLDLLFLARIRLGSRQPIHLISGYRSPKTNAMLRRHSKGVARHSLHMEGKAADIRIPGVALEHLRRVALSLSAGGVGYYPHLDFVHMDTGRVRWWQER